MECWSEEEEGLISHLNSEALQRSGESTERADGIAVAGDTATIIREQRGESVCPDLIFVSITHTERHTFHLPGLESVHALNRPLLSLVQHLLLIVTSRHQPQDSRHVTDVRWRTSDHDDPARPPAIGCVLAASRAEPVMCRCRGTDPFPPSPFSRVCERGGRVGLRGERIPTIAGICV